MSLPYNKFIVIPKKHYEEMATVYYNKLSPITVTPTNIYVQNDLPSRSNDSNTFNSMFNSDEISTDCTHSQADLSADINESVSDSSSDSSSDSDCVIIDEIAAPSCTNEIVNNPAQESCISKCQTPLDCVCPYCDHFSSSCSSSSSSSSNSSIDSQSANFRCIVALNRLTTEELTKYPSSKTIQLFLNNNQSETESNDESSNDSTDQFPSSTMETRRLVPDYRQELHSLARLIDELADFDFPINRRVTTDDVNAWCIKKAIETINNYKNNK